MEPEDPDYPAFLHKTEDLQLGKIPYFIGGLYYRHFTPDLAFCNQPLSSKHTLLDLRAPSASPNYAVLFLSEVRPLIPEVLTTWMTRLSGALFGSPFSAAIARTPTREEAQAHWKKEQSGLFKERIPTIALCFYILKAETDPLLKLQRRRKNRLRQLTVPFMVGTVDERPPSNPMIASDPKRAFSVQTLRSQPECFLTAVAAIASCLSDGTCQQRHQLIAADPRPVILRTHPGFGPQAAILPHEVNNPFPVLFIIRLLRRNIPLMRIISKVPCVPPHEIRTEAVSQLLERRHCFIEHQEISTAGRFQDSQAKGFRVGGTQKQIGQREQFQHALPRKSLLISQIGSKDHIPCFQAEFLPFHPDRVLVDSAGNIRTGEITENDPRTLLRLALNRPCQGSDLLKPLAGGEPVRDRPPKYPHSTNRCCLPLSARPG